MVRKYFTGPESDMRVSVFCALGRIYSSINQSDNVENVTYI
jgi:hypothetical protein